MTIQEAIKSGKRFKRKSEKDWRWKPVQPGMTILKDTFHVGHLNLVSHSYSESDVLAEDWEVEEISLKISESEFRKACEKAVFNFSNLGIGTSLHRFDILAKELGFTP